MKSISFIFDYSKLDVILGDYLDKCKETRASILHHQKLCARNNKFIQENLAKPHRECHLKFNTVETTNRIKVRKVSMPAGLPGTMHSGNPYQLLESDKKKLKNGPNFKSKEILLTAVKEKLHKMSKTTISQDLSYKDPRMTYLLKHLEMNNNPLKTIIDTSNADDIFNIDPNSINKSSGSFEIDMLNNELASLENKVSKLRVKMKELQSQELLRVFKEFISHDYEKRYRVTIEVITSALTGEEYTLLDLSKMFNKISNHESALANESVEQME